MSEDRFKPPASDVGDPRPGKGSAVKGVVAGLAVDLGGTMLFGLLLSIVYGIAMAAAGRSADEIGGALAHAEADPLLSTTLIAGGVLCSVLGGYVCERVARQGSYRVGIVLAALSVLAGFAFGSSGFSAAMTGLLMFLTVGSVLLGTRLGFGSAARPER